MATIRGTVTRIRIQGGIYDADLVVQCLHAVRAAGRLDVGTCVVEPADIKTMPKKESRLLQIRGLGWRVYVMPLNPDNFYASIREAM